MSVDFIRKTGTYYVRAFLVYCLGKTYEIVSNSVTTSGEFLSFGLTGKAEQIILERGRYRLEVWGAQGGDSTGKGDKLFNYSYFSDIMLLKAKINIF